MNMKMQVAVIAIWTSLLTVQVCSLVFSVSAYHRIHRKNQETNRLNEDTERIVRELEIIQEQNSRRMQRIMDSIK